MPISDKDREDYKEGQRDRERDKFLQGAEDLLDPRKKSDAYYAGRRGEPLDEESDEEEGDEDE